jgi:tetratricopeptide (TPR) repeat protein
MLWASQPMDRLESLADSSQEASLESSSYEKDRLQLLKSLESSSIKDGEKKRLPASHYLERADLYVRVEGNLPAALDDAEAALEMEPGNTKGLSIKAHALEGLLRMDEAASVLETLVELKPESALQKNDVVMFYVGWARRLTGEKNNKKASFAWAKARKHLEELIEKSETGKSKDYHLLGQLCENLGDMKSASIAYRTAILGEQDSTPLLVYVKAAEAHIDLEEYDLAIRSYQDAIERLQKEHEGLEESKPQDGASLAFPPEWRIRLAQLLKAAGRQCEASDMHGDDHAGSLDCHDHQLMLAIKSIDALRMLMPPSPCLYALRAVANSERGRSLQARSDALKAVRYYNAKYPNATPLGTNQSTEAIVRAVLGNDHLLFRPIFTPIASPTPTM